MDLSTHLENLTPAGRRVLDVAARMFYEQGIHAVGVDAIASGAEVTKKTLYACFGSKDYLIAAYLYERDQRWRRWLTDWVDTHAEDDQVSSIFAALDAWLSDGNSRGCAFVNALAELPHADHPGHGVVLEQKRWMLEYLTEAVAASGSATARDTARELMLLVEGASVLASIGCFPRAVDYASSAAVALAR